MTEWWDKQIQRADRLATAANGSKDLLTFYGFLLRAQRDIYESLRSRRDWLPTGEIESDLPVIRDQSHRCSRPFINMDQRALPKKHENGPNQIRTQLSYWQSPSDLQFFGKACFQLYLRWLVATGVRPAGRQPTVAEYCCPICGGRRQVSFLQNKDTTAESGKILGTPKLLGVAALLYNRFPLLKEWPYPGFTFGLIGAFWSHLAPEIPSTSPWYLSDSLQSWRFRT